MRNVAAVRVKPYFFWKFFVDLKKKKKVREKFALGAFNNYEDKMRGEEGVKKCNSVLSTLRV